MFQALLACKNLIKNNLNPFEVAVMTQIKKKPNRVYIGIAIFILVIILGFMFG